MTCEAQLDFARGWRAPLPPLRCTVRFLQEAGNGAGAQSLRHNPNAQVVIAFDYYAQRFQDQVTGQRRNQQTHRMAHRTPIRKKLS